MSRLIKVAGWAGKPRASVIFVHGLGGHAYDTWRRAPNDDSFWPLWLAQDVEGLSIYTLAYEAPPTNWLGTAMPLQDRAVNILETLLGVPNLRDGGVVFICHSLGGLIVKQVMLDLARQKARRPEAAALLDCVKQIVFAATPHTGSRQGSLLERLRFLAWPSSIARVLVANDPTLRAINVNYRELADDRRNVLQHRIFYETRNTPLGTIVDEASADPGLVGLPPIPIDADHISIVKPVDRQSLLYSRTRDFISEIPASTEQGTGYEARPLSDIKLEQPWNIAPKAIRLALLALVCTIAFKGVQALISPPPIISSENFEKLASQQQEIKVIVDKLFELNQVRPALGRERAVTDAVAATIQGANEGDSREQRALELLKAGRAAEAEPLLLAIAEEKDRLAKSAHKDAAAAYRRLGAIAGLGDPKRAREAYSRALERDPDDREALYWHGWLQLLAGNLNLAESDLNRLLQASQAANDEHGVYRAHLRLGEVLLHRGNLQEAREHQDRAFDIAKSNAERSKTDLEWQRDLSVSYEKIGDVLVAQGNLPEAIKYYRDDLAIMEHLARSDPRNAQWQYDLGIMNERIGDVLFAQGDIAEAAKSYSAKQEIISRLANEGPANVGWQRDLSVSYDRIGELLVAQGHLAEAAKSFSNSLAIRERLAKADPGNAEWQRDLSVSYATLADIYRKASKMREAREALANGRDIIARLVANHPDQEEWKRNLIWFDEHVEMLKNKENEPKSIQHSKEGPKPKRHAPN